MDGRAKPAHGEVLGRSPKLAALAPLACPLDMLAR